MVDKIRSTVGEIALKVRKKSCSSELGKEKGSFGYMEVLEWCFSFLCML